MMAIWCLLRLLKWDSSGSTLFASPFLIYNCHTFGSIGRVQTQSRKSQFQKLRVEMFKLC